jgi:S1-C subfamily serine protease
MPRIVAIAAAVLALGLSARGQAQSVPVNDLAAAVVRLKTYINPEARTGGNLGHQREGSAVVIDSGGLLLTIGYLMVEAQAAEIVTNEGRAVAVNIVGYDHESGFGLLQASAPLNIQPIQMGSSAELKEGQAAAIIGAGGVRRIAAVEVVSRREFAGNWEYLLDDAIFTTPAYPNWSGTALVNAEGKLVGIGSLIVGDAGRKGAPLPGNMFVPIDRLPPILGDLLATGHAGTATPWLGITTEDGRRGLVVARVVPGGPAEKAGIRRGDVIVGVGGKQAEDLADFYRKVRAVGSAGVTVPLDIEREGSKQRIDIPSANRRDHLKLNSTL